MSIEQVRAQFNGTWYTLSYNPATGAYEAQITAPTLPGMYPTPVEVRGSQWTTKKTAEIEVRAELEPPVVVITTPPGYYNDPAHPVSFTLRDNAGIALDTLSVLLDGEPVTGAVSEPAEGGYDCVYTPPALADGPHTLAVTVKDINGNESAPAQLTWHVDTTGPTLAVSFPPDGYNTNRPALTVTGLAGDTGVGLAWLRINGADVPVTDGGFSWSATLTEGDNLFTMTAEDSLGNTSTLSFGVLLDTIPPKITAVTVAPDLDGQPMGLTYLVIADIQPSPEPHAAETVTGTVNGLPVTFVQDGQRWTAVVPRAVDFTVELLASDAAGNTDRASVYFPNGLESKLDWTRLDYLNFWDLNRIERNTRFVYGAAISLGRTPPHGWRPRHPVPAQDIPVAGHEPHHIPEHTQWLASDILFKADLDRLNQNVEDLKGVLALYRGEWVPIRLYDPLDWRTLLAIEKDLTLVDRFLSCYQSHKATPVYAGQIPAGVWP